MRVLGPNLTFTRVSSSPADNDRLGDIHFKGRNDADESVEYVAFQASIQDASDGTEDGRITFNIIKNGSAIESMRLQADETTFNDASADIDFRVESDGNANMFIVDAGENIVLVATLFRFRSKFIFFCRWSYL